MLPSFSFYTHLQEFLWEIRIGFNAPLLHTHSLFLQKDPHVGIRQSSTSARAHHNGGIHEFINLLVLSIYLQSPSQHAREQYKEWVILGEIMASPYLGSGDFPVGERFRQ